MSATTDMSAEATAIRLLYASELRGVPLASLTRPRAVAQRRDR